MRLLGLLCHCNYGLVWFAIVRTSLNCARSSPEPWDSQAICRDSCSTFLVLLIPGLEFERWLNATGPPLAEPDLSQGSSLTRPVETLFKLWTTEPLDSAAAASSVDLTKWRTFQTVLFLDRLLDGSPLPHGEYSVREAEEHSWNDKLNSKEPHPTLILPFIVLRWPSNLTKQVIVFSSVYVLSSEVIKKLSECYSSQLDSMNAEIRIRWLQIVVRNDYYPDLYKVRRFLENQVLSAGLKSLHLSVHETCAWDMRRERPWNFCFLAKCRPGV